MRSEEKYRNESDSPVKKYRTIILYCAGSGLNLINGSLIERWYEDTEATELFIRSTLNKTETTPDDDRPLAEDSDVDSKLLPNPYDIDSKDDNLPSELVREGDINSLQGRIDKLYLAGPGCDSYDYIMTPGHESPALGIPKSEIKEKINPKHKSSFSKEFYYGEDTHVDEDSDFEKLIYGKAFGKGYRDNVIKACTIIANAIGSDHEYEQIIIVGFSRGGVTAQYIAYTLYEMGIMTPVHIFSIDPVEGSKKGILDKATRTIGGNVVSMNIILAKGDPTERFFPQGPERQDILDNKKTQVNYYPVEGTHSQVAGAPIESSLNPECASAFVVIDLFMNFFSRTLGIDHQILPNPGITSSEIINHYTYMQVFSEQFRYVLEKRQSYADYFYTKAIRPFLLQPSIAGEFHSFFMNQRHQDLFEKTHPIIFRKIKEQTITLEDIVSETKTSEEISYLTRVSLATSLMLQPLSFQIDHLSKQQFVSTNLGEQLLNLKELARIAIVTHLNGNPTTSPEWKKESLDSLPEVKICNNAATMVETILKNKTTTSVTKYKVISKFYEDSCKLVGEKSASIPLKECINTIFKVAKKLLNKAVKNTIKEKADRMLQPLSLQIDQLSKQSHPCPDLIKQLVDLKGLVRTEIVTYLNGEASTSLESKEKSLDSLPAVQICNNATTMVETILKTNTTTDAKYEAISKFNLDSSIADEKSAPINIKLCTNEAEKWLDTIVPAEEIANSMLQPLSLQIKQLSEQHKYPCPDLKKELLSLKKLAKEAIVTHLDSKESTYSEWKKGHLDLLPEVKICNNAARMVETVLKSNTTIDARHEAISQFNEDPFIEDEKNTSIDKQCIGKIYSLTEKWLGEIVSTEEIADDMLKPLSSKINQLEQDQYRCPALEKELNSLKDLAKKAIVTHLKRKQTTFSEWKSESLKSLPEVKICNNAATMVGTILKPKITIDAKYEAISKFNEDSRKLAGEKSAAILFKQCIGRICSVAVKWIGAIVSTVVSFAVENTIDEKAKITSRKIYGFFAYKPIAQRAQKAVVLQERMLLKSM